MGFIWNKQTNKEQIWKQYYYYHHTNTIHTILFDDMVLYYCIILLPYSSMILAASSPWSRLLWWWPGSVLPTTTPSNRLACIISQHPPSPACCASACYLLYISWAEECRRYTDQIYQTWLALRCRGWWPVTQGVCRRFSISSSYAHQGNIIRMSQLTHHARGPLI